MTLLIATISDRHAIITADGLSKANLETGKGVRSDTFQKIFPVPHHPIAFAHHGLNILEGKSIDEYIADYIQTFGAVFSNARIKDIAEDLLSHSEQAALTTLAHPTNSGVIAFWVVGFGAGKTKPELYEVCWPDRPAPHKLTRLVLGGNGKLFISDASSLRIGSFSPGRVGAYSVSDALRYHDLLYKQAEAEQLETGQVVFGGHQHQLVLHKNGWRWEKCPFGL